MMRMSTASSVGFTRKLTRKHGRKRDVKTDSLSRVGIVHERDGIPNQDASFTMLRPDTVPPSKHKRSTAQVLTNGMYAFGVFDGHGDEGHIASQLASSVAQKTLEKLFTSNYKDAKACDYLRLTFEIMANTLNAHHCGKASGTTATIAIVYQSELVIGHVGDSCAIVLASQGLRNRATVRYVSSMHRTDLETERNRIQHAGGIVQGGYVVDKVTKNTGIAVTRTIGDVDMRKNGCISIPQIKTMQLETSDKAIVIATDGLWDAQGVVLQDVLDSFLSSQRDPDMLNQALMSIASRSGPWDDCTIASLIFV